MSGKQPAINENLTEHQLEVDGARRSFLVYRPNSNKNLPVVFSFHGSFSSHKDMMKHTQLNKLAERENFIAVYPLMGYQFILDVTDAQARVDSRFIEKLIAHIVMSENADEGRVFATGFSSGADMLHYFGTLKNLANKFNAFAPVCSNLCYSWQQQLNHKLPVSMLMLSGTRDKLNRWKGTPPRSMSVPDTYKFWCEHNGAKTASSKQNSFTEKMEAFKHRMPNAESAISPESKSQNVSTKSTRLILSQSQNEESGAHVVLGKIIGGGHTWPGAAERNHLLRVICGRTHSMHSANEIIWSFFQSR